MIDISKSVGYAIHALIYIATRKNKEFVQASEVARECGLSISYMMKILQALRRAGIVDSTIGVKGGYVLARPLDKITLYDIIVAIEPQGKKFVIFQPLLVVVLERLHREKFVQRSKRGNKGVS